MPTLADIQAATPKCPQMHAGPPTPGRVMRTHERCAKPLRYLCALDRWTCPRHGQVWTGPTLAQARQAAAA